MSIEIGSIVKHRPELDMFDFIGNAQVVSLRTIGSTPCAHIKIFEQPLRGTVTIPVECLVISEPVKRKRIL